MSKTPRVDAYMAANYSDAVFGHHLADFARQLEAENAELRAALEKALKALEVAPHSLAYGITPIPKIRALLERIGK